MSVLPSNIAKSPCAPLFALLWSKRIEHTTPRSIKEAVSVLRESTRLTREHFARRLLLTTSQVVNLESNGRPCTLRTLERLESIAQDYRFFVLEDYFNGECSMLKASGKRKRT